MTTVRRPLRRLFVLTVCALVVGPAGPAGGAPGPPSAPQYWFDDWHVFNLWDAGVRGQGVKIAEIDTGVNADLPDLTGRVLPGTDLGQAGNGQVDRDRDQFGHGTAMASIMVARPGNFDVTGMAPGAKIIPIAVPLNGTTDSGRPDRLADAIRYGADHGANIISMSLGGKRFAKSDTTSCPPDEQAAVFDALRKGVIVVASVGNTGPRKNTIEEPGVCLGVVSVGAVDAKGNVADFSARQPYLTLVAPGVGVATIGRVEGRAYSGDGTSQAAAVASASMALVWSKYPKLTGRQVVTRVLATLDRHGGTAHSSAYGYGEINAYRAVTEQVDVNAPDPVYDTAAPFLARDAALAEAAAAVKPPKPVATTKGDFGRYTVGSAPRVSPRVQLGVGVAGAGLLALLVLAGFGRRRRRARVAALAAVPGSPGGYARPAGEAPAQPGLRGEHAEASSAPRPRPTPHPRDPEDQAFRD